MSGFLASVNSLDEALQLQGQGVDIIDLKQPAQGALGALPVAEVAAVVSALKGGTERISATVGDLPMQPAVVVEAVQAMAATGVDFVKIGFFPGGDWAGVMAALRPLAAKHALVAVLFADQPLDLAIVDTLAQAGFAGVMLDTMDKQRGALPELLATAVIAEFVLRAKARRLMTGLAGALRTQHIAALLPLQADYLGFRGALCADNQRTAALCFERVSAIKTLLSPVV